MRQYLRGDALKSIGLEHSGYANQAAKKRLERKHGGHRRKILLRIDGWKFQTNTKLDSKRNEKFADLVNIAVANLTDAKYEDELVN